MIQNKHALRITPGLETILMRSAYLEPTTLLDMLVFSRHEYIGVEYMAY